MHSFKLAAVGVLLLVNTLCLGAINPQDIGPLFEKLAFAKYDVTDREREAISQIDKLGPAAVPYLLPLLRHKDETVRRMAAWVLGDMNDLGEEHLDALIESRLQGNPSIAAAIARVGTPRAIAFLVEELKKKPTDTQIYWAFYILGEKGVPSLVRLIESKPLDNELASAAVSIFGWLKGKAKGSVPILQKLAQDDPRSYKEVVDRVLSAMNAPETIADTLRRLGAKNEGSSARSNPWPKLREQSSVDSLIEFVSARAGNETAVGWAVLVLSTMGHEARRAVPVLQKLAEQDPVAHRDSVDHALLYMEAAEAIPGLLRQLERGKPDHVLFLRIAMLRQVGRPTGPALVRYLEDNNWQLRVDAAQTVGYIEYAEATPRLIELLREKDDWRLVFVSAQSLGRLRAAEAVGPLTELSKNHWYPPVREAAKKAMLVIAGQETYPASSKDGIRFMFEFEDYKLTKAPNAIRSGQIGPQDDGQSQDRLDQEQLAKLAYEEELSSSYVDGNSGRTVEEHHTVERVPKVGIKVDDGYLVGWDQGEFGGELLFIDPTGKRTRLWGNTQGIHRMASGIVAVTGYAHFTNDGMLLKVFRGQDGLWRVSRWKSLPGCPRGSTMLANGNVRVDCGSNGCVEITAEGDIKMAGSGE